MLGGGGTSAHRRTSAANTSLSLSLRCRPAAVAAAVRATLCVMLADGVGVVFTEQTIYHGSAMKGSSVRGEPGMFFQACRLQWNRCPVPSHRTPFSHSGMFLQ